MSWAMLCQFLDIFKLPLAFAFLICDFNYFAILLPVLHLIIMFVFVKIKKGNFKFELDESISLLPTFATSLWWEDQGYTSIYLPKIAQNGQNYRWPTKVISNSLITIGLICSSTYYGLHKTSRVHLNTKNCKEACNSTESQLNHCREFSLPNESYETLLVFLWILVALSLLEGIFEKYFNWMPYNKYVQGLEIPNDKENEGKQRSRFCFLFYLKHFFLMISNQHEQQKFLEPLRIARGKI